MNPSSKSHLPLSYKNRILAALSSDEIERLTPHLSPTDFKLRQPLLDGVTADYAYFLEDGLASVVLSLEDGATVEVGVIGIDGVVGLPVLLSVEKMPGETFIPRLLLLRGNFGQESKPMPIIAKISQDTLAKMVGTTRPRIGFFMNRFRKLGFVEYGGGRVHIHSSLPSVVLHD